MVARQASDSNRETSRTDDGVFERLAEELDRSRLREGPDMRSHICATLDALEPALAAHCREASEGAALTARLQHGGIESLIKDMRIIASDPVRYPAGHLASLSFLLSKALREHLDASGRT